MGGIGCVFVSGHMAGSFNASRMHAHTHVHMHTCIHATCMHAFTYACSHARMHRCAYVPMHQHGHSIFVFRFAGRVIIPIQRLFRSWLTRKLWARRVRAAHCLAPCQLHCHFGLSRSRRAAESPTECWPPLMAASLRASCCRPPPPCRRRHRCCPSCRPPPPLLLRRLAFIHPTFN